MGKVIVARTCGYPTVFEICTPWFLVSLFTAVVVDTTVIARVLRESPVQLKAWREGIEFILWLIVSVSFR